MADYAISACLCGVKCRYDGKITTDKRCLKLYESGNAILICPEIEGGMTTPRPPCERLGEKVIASDGSDKTKEYYRGASNALKKCRKAGVKIAILKERSPSCGSSLIYDGTFSGKRISGKGVCAQEFEKGGIKVFSEETFEFCL